MITTPVIRTECHADESRGLLPVGVAALLVVEPPHVLAREHQTTLTQQTGLIVDQITTPHRNTLHFKMPGSAPLVAPLLAALALLLPATVRAPCQHIHAHAHPGISRSPPQRHHTLDNPWPKPPAVRRLADNAHPATMPRQPGLLRPPGQPTALCFLRHACCSHPAHHRPPVWWGGLLCRPFESMLCFVYCFVVHCVCMRLLITLQHRKTHWRSHLVPRTTRAWNRLTSTAGLADRLSIHMTLCVLQPWLMNAILLR